MANSAAQISTNAANIAAHIFSSQVSVAGITLASVTDAQLATIAQVAVRLAKQLDAAAGA